MVAGGQLTAGSALPSIRDLAQSLAVNPMTVSRAYSDLEILGILERRRGIGMRVAANHNRPQSKANREALLLPVLEQAAAMADQLGIDEAQAVDLFKNAFRKTP